jgi:ribosomal protein L40E
MTRFSKHDSTRTLVEIFTWSSIAVCVSVALFLFDQAVELYGIGLGSYRTRGLWTALCAMVVMLFGPTQALVIRAVCFTVLDTNDKMRDIPTSGEIAALLRATSAQPRERQQASEGPRQSARKTKRVRVAQTVWICHACSLKNDPRAGFCRSCGTPMLRS